MEASKPLDYIFEGKITQQIFLLKQEVLQSSLAMRDGKGWGQTLTQTDWKNVSWTWCSHWLWNKTRHYRITSFNIFEFRCAIPSSRPKRLSMESRMHPGTQWKWQVEQLEVVWRHGIWWVLFCFVLWFFNRFGEAMELMISASCSICSPLPFVLANFFVSFEKELAHWWCIFFGSLSSISYIVRKTPDGMKNHMTMGTMKSHASLSIGILTK